VSASSVRLQPRLTCFLIVEDGLFGYELIPDRKRIHYLIIWCNSANEATCAQLRKASVPQRLQVVAPNGRFLSRSERAARYVSSDVTSIPNWRGC
jgi:hypothetical protein